MKIILTSFVLLMANYLYAGPIRDGIVWEVEKKLLYIPQKMMTDENKGKFLRNLHNEITDKDEMIILQTYIDIVTLLGMEDPLGFLNYIKEKDADALKKMQEKAIEMNKKEEVPKVEKKPKKNAAPSELQKHLNSIKEAQEYGEQLLKED